MRVDGGGLQRRWAGVLVVLVAAVAGAVGILVGTGAAPDEQDAATARTQAFRLAETTARSEAFESSQADGVRDGNKQGAVAGRSEGAAAGARIGKSKVGSRLAAIAAAEAAAQEAAVEATFPPPGTIYSPQLPHGKPGYVLPEDERTLSCVGIDAVTGECVGD